MIFTTGRVHKGSIEIEPQSLPEGARVMVLALEGDETFDLSAEEKAAILAAVAELERGEFVEGSELLRSLRSR